MPNLIKPKPKKNLGYKKRTKSATTSKKQILTVPTAKSTPKSKTSPTAYYNCLLNFANQNWHHPVTGQKKKITACCRECKLNAPALNSEKDKELVKLITSYKQVGDSLAKLLKPIK